MLHVAGCQPRDAAPGTTPRGRASQRDRRRCRMEPLLIILIPGLLGGLALALLIAATRRRPVFPVVSRRLEAPDPSLINMAHIRVEGIGGLGLVAAVVAVAITDPRIRLAIVIAAILGSGLALLLIALHRRLDARRSGGRGSDDR